MPNNRPIYYVEFTLLSQKTKMRALSLREKPDSIKCPPGVVYYTIKRYDLALTDNGPRLSGPIDLPTVYFPGARVILANYLRRGDQRHRKTMAESGWSKAIVASNGRLFPVAADYCVVRYFSD